MSALNRIIAIKSDLGVLFYFDGNRLMTEYDIKDVNDVLTIIDGNGEPFVYDRANAASLKVQKTIFCEKRLIIENCLFGVDINDKAVSICQLRLWIELLKNAYYENNVMETLPNIDINIKCGNSLLHKLPVEVGKRLSEKVEKNLSALIKDYKENVKAYKRESNKANKQRTKDAISRVKRFLNQTHFQTSMDFMGETPNYEEIDLMRNAFEWSIEFPEVLADDGTFLGFDCIIGNPPYVSVKAIDANLKNAYRRCSITAQGRFNLFTLMIEKGCDLLKTKGRLSYILPEALFTNVEYKYIREFFLARTHINQIVLFDKRVFDAAVETAVFIITKELKDHNVFSVIRKEDYQEKKSYIDQAIIKAENDYLIPVSQNQDNAPLLNRLSLIPEQFGAYIEIQQGIIYSGLSKEEVFSNEEKTPDYKKCLDGRDVLRWYINWENKKENRFIEYTKKLHRPREERLFLASEKLLLARKSTKINCGYDASQFYALNTAYIILANEKCVENKINLKYILGLLNSKLLNYYYSNVYLGWQITIPALKSLPFIYNPTLADQVVNCVDSILMKKGESIDTEENEIDRLVYEIYGLSPDEISLIKA